MSAASNYTEQNVINSLLRGVMFPTPAGTYVSLHTADPGETGVNEVTTLVWPAYVRRHAEQGDAAGTGWIEPVDGVTHNTKQITYPGMDDATEGASVTITHCAVWDALSGGNMLVHAALQTPRTLVYGDVFVFDIGTLVVSLA